MSRRSQLRLWGFISAVVLGVLGLMIYAGGLK